MVEPQPEEVDEPPRWERVWISRRRFLLAAGALGLTGAGLWRWRSGSSQELAPASQGVSGELDEFATNIRSGGPPKDGIPPIDEPHFIAASDAKFLEDEDVVFGLVMDEEARAYPQLVLVWHEIVNDGFPSGPVSITYCPLTGSPVGFRGRSLGGEPLTFGTSGDLVNSNLLMYDRQTDSRWPQILGRAITGPARGEELEEIPVDWTTWGRWRRTHPETKVLSTETGHLRRYGDDPYGSYRPIAGYYKEGSDLYFPVMSEDSRFDKKEVVIGAKPGKARAAVRKDFLRQRKVVSGTAGNSPLAFLYDPSLDEGRAFTTRVANEEVVVVPDEGPGRFRDRSSGSLLDANGRFVFGPLKGAELERVSSYDVMWFAWAAFFPETEVLG